MALYLNYLDYVQENTRNSILDLYVLNIFIWNILQQRSNFQCWKREYLTIYL